MSQHQFQSVADIAVLPEGVAPVEEVATIARGINAIIDNSLCVRSVQDFYSTEGLCHRQI